jgi:hypothetical protein
MSFIKIGLRIEIRLPLIGLFPKALGLTKFMEKCFKIKKCKKGGVDYPTIKKFALFGLHFLPYRKNRLPYEKNALDLPLPSYAIVWARSWTSS